MKTKAQIYRMRICCQCQRRRRETSFNWKVLDKWRQAMCRDCSKLYAKEHYKQNRAYYIEKSRKAKAQIRLRKNHTAKCQLVTLPNVAPLRGWICTCRRVVSSTKTN